MNTEYIHEFVVLAETKNFWEASERLFMNQSTLSKHIKSLEIELGVPLFTRTTRRVELTNYGHTFLPYAQSIARAEFSGTSAIKQLLNIEDIFVSEITAQYLALMDDLSDVDMDRASAFLTVAAQLLLIKSRSLLPRPPVETDEEESPEQQLLRQLRPLLRWYISRPGQL